MNSLEKRKSVMKDYDLIAKQYCDEFGTTIEDTELIRKFESHLPKNASIIDLGGGPGKVANYFGEKGFDAVCYDFSENMMKYAKNSYPALKYILDDIINIKAHFSEASIDGIIAMYSLFHIPKEDMEQLFLGIKSILKKSGIFCFSLQLGSGEEFVDEPYLKENGKNVLYMNYLNKSEIYDLLSETGFEVIYESEQHEAGDNVIGENGNDAIYLIARKRENCDDYDSQRTTCGVNTSNSHPFFNMKGTHIIGGSDFREQFWREEMDRREYEKEDPQVVITLFAMVISIIIFIIFVFNNSDLFFKY